MIDFGASYSAKWRCAEVDPSTWEDSGLLGAMASASVERDSESQLLESGTVELDVEPGTRVGETWCRIEMDASQGDAVERHAVAALLLCQTSSTDDRGRSTARCYGRSVLAPAADVKMRAGSYAPKGCDGAKWAADLLRQCTPAPIAVEGSFTLEDHVVFGAGDSYLEAAWAVLDAAGWRIRIDGMGTAYIGPRADEVSLELDRAHAKLLMPEVTEDNDVTEARNRYTAIDGDEVATVVNEDPYDPTSYASRGRYSDEVDTSPTRVDGESLEAYARRRLLELAVKDVRSYTREWWPGVVPGCVVRGSIAERGLDGDMRVASQSVTCGRGATVSERAERI